ncbi:MAG: shikimate dehydrogenase [Bacteroidota bacterium]
MEKVKAVLGLIGFPLGHSWSAKWFNEKFKKEGDVTSSYHLFPLKDITGFPAFIQSNPLLTGLNVTIPYKEKIIPYLDELDDSAASIGAVNTIRIERVSGKIHTTGFNTDGGGFLQTLTDQMIPNRALILGTGGASRAVAWALQEKGVPYSFVSREKQGSGILSYQELTPEIISAHHFIVNTTPLGTYPGITTSPPIPYHLLSGNHFLYDLVYNPGETIFIKSGKARKCNTMNGLQMLLNQAALSYNIFSGGI